MEGVVEGLHRHWDVTFKALVHRVPHNLGLQEGVDLMVDELLLQVFVDLICDAASPVARAASIILSISGFCTHSIEAQVPADLE